MACASVDSAQNLHDDLLLMDDDDLLLMDERSGVGILPAEATKRLV